MAMPGAVSAIAVVPHVFDPTWPAPTQSARPIAVLPFTESNARLCAVAA
jgi:hypothetical protein